MLSCPHSLGISFEWKRNTGDRVNIYLSCPHSLGISFEWKLIAEIELKIELQSVPTRWGCHLNENRFSSCLAFLARSVPTRWGCHLNGNFRRT